MTDKCDEWDFNRPPKPMTDIVERLRTVAPGHQLVQEAADEIERLRYDRAAAYNEIERVRILFAKAETEIERLRMTLIDIRDSADWGNTTSGEGHARCREDAARALEG